MNVYNQIKNFIGDEDGAVTVDWVVLTAAIVGMGLMIILIFADGLSGASSVVRVGIIDAVADGLALN